MANDRDGWAQHDADEAAMFRVMYSTGRAGPTYSTVREAVANLDDCDSYVQRRELGRWVTYRGPRSTSRAPK
jgi:hypothetical protein